MKNLVYIVIVLVVIVYLFNSNTEKDDTDPQNGYSNMSLFTDYGTGCQYLGTSLFGPQIPRLDRNGNQICE